MSSEIEILKSQIARRQAELAGLRTMTFNLAPAAIAILDQNLRYESVNPAYCALTGYCAEELVGRPFTNWLSPESSQVDFFAAAQSPAAHPLQPLKFKKKDGSVAEIEWQIATATSSGVRILIAADVTQPEQAARARESLLASTRAARSEAEGSNRLNEEFLAAFSHELRNPLNAILGWATILSRKPGLPEPVMHGLQAIERNSRIQAQMLSDMLDYAAIAFGKVRLIVETIDPYPVVRAALDLVNTAAEAAGITIRASFGEESLRIEADAFRLQQIARHLLSNALKSSARGGEVAFTAGRSGDSFSLVVSNQGTGTIAGSHGGLGLGIAIVKQLTELHGGSIHALSAEKGLGSTFTVRLPLKPQHLDVGLEQ
jgi:PAS domain S-box-containing protein